MGKYLLCLLLALVTLTGFALAVEVTVDGETLPVPSVAVRGTTYTPLTPLLEALGGWETAWDPAGRAASSETDLFSLTVTEGSANALADGEAYPLSGSVFLTGGRTYVPLRSLCNLLGATVDFTGWDAPIAVTSSQAGSYSGDDLYWLARIISAESGGESLLGQIAVGNVVLNRVASSEFPGTIRGVIFDTKDAVQFEPVSNGTIYDTPTDLSVLAAKLTLNGTAAVEGCLYFFNPSLSQGTWIRQNRSYALTIGCHRFYR
jgi:N-acetylmuramoyl-L-alanine amidase